MEITLQVARLVDQLPAEIKNGLPNFGQFRRPLGAIKKGQSDAIFEKSHLSAHSRLGHVEFLGGIAETVLFKDGKERAQVVGGERYHKFQY